MSDDEAEAMFRKVRWADTNGELSQIRGRPHPAAFASLRSARRPPSPSGRDGASGEETVSPHAHSLRITLIASATHLSCRLRARCSYPSPEGGGWPPKRSAAKR